MHAKIGNGTEIGERFHEGERGAGDNPRPGERQRNAEEASPGTVARATRDFKHAVRLLEERRARKQVDIRIEHEREHRHRSP